MILADTILRKGAKVQLDCLLYLPKDYEQQESWPLLLFLLVQANF